MEGLYDKNLTQREGRINRHTNGMPLEKCNIKVIYKDVDSEHIHTCEWRPFNKEEYTDVDMPGTGYLGTAKVIEGRFTGIGFHAW